MSCEKYIYIYIYLLMGLRINTSFAYWSVSDKEPKNTAIA